jgi:transcriptional regulator
MREEIPPGTLDMLILGTLARAGEELHGFQVAEAIAGTSAGVFAVEEGSLYPALQRMLMQGWIAGRWDRTPGNRRARYYRVTPSGRRHLDKAVKSYARVTRAIGTILDLSPYGA